MTFLPLIALLTVANGQQEPLLVKFKFDPGRVDKVSVSNEIVQTFSGPEIGEPVRQTMLQTVEMMTGIRAGEANGFLFDLQIKNIKLKSDLEGPMREFELESLEGLPGPIGDAMRVIKEAKFTLHFSSEPKLIKVTGFEELIAEFEKLGAPAHVVADMRQNMSLNEIEDRFVNGIVGLSTGKPLNAGDSWTKDEDVHVEEMGNIRLTVTRTFSGYETRDGRRIARISVRSTGKVLKPDHSDPEVKLDVKTLTQNGYLYFDVDAGWIIEQFIEQTTNFVATVTEEGETIKMNGIQRLKAKMFTKVGVGQPPARSLVHRN